MNHPTTTDPWRVLLIGTGFMGDVHSHAWRSVSPVFGTRAIRLARVIARNPERLTDFAERWGWESSSTDLETALEGDEVDLVDVTSPNSVHAEHVQAALQAGCHVLCEKPMASTLTDAAAMLDSAAHASGRAFVWYNYRRVPAITLARQLVADGRLGQIQQVRAAYLQSWGRESDHTWRFDAAVAGSGAHGDINAHIVDTARFVTGDDIVEILGSAQDTFVSHRDAGRSDADPVASTVDDVSVFVARLSSGALATFEASRIATGFLCANRIEVHGDQGAIRFDFEHMNRLEFFDATDPGREQGWRSIHVTRGQHGHPYVDHWWPEGHGIGYEHTFIHHAADVLANLEGQQPLAPLADFRDAYQTERILHAATISARERSPIIVADVGPKLNESLVGNTSELAAE